MMQSLEVNKRVVSEYVAAFNARNYDKLRTLFTRDAVIYGVLGKGGIDVVEPIWKELHSGLNMQLQVDEMIAQGNSVTCRYTERGQFIAPFRRHAPTGKSYEAVAMEWFVLEDEMIIQRWGARDSATIARQIGMPLS